MATFDIQVREPETLVPEPGGTVSALNCTPELGALNCDNNVPRQAQLGALNCDTTPPSRPQAGALNCDIGAPSTGRPSALNCVD